jgi:PucR family transcriptional regulator, purine catabolism regulatory protein
VVEVPDEKPTVLLTSAHRAAAPDIVLLQQIATAAAVLLANEVVAANTSGVSEGNCWRIRSTTGSTRTTLFDSSPSANLPPAAGARLGSSTSISALTGAGFPTSCSNGPACSTHYFPPPKTRSGCCTAVWGSDTAVGVIDPLGSPARAAAAVREANWAVRAAANVPRRLSRLRTLPLSVLRDTEEAQVGVDHVLGQLLRYDAEYGSDLRRTLDIFLTHDRSWQQAAATGVHRQTVVYRMRRVEITGRNLSVTAHITELWLALRARDLLSTPG